jgi:hypothetical protein
VRTSSGEGARAGRLRGLACPDLGESIDFLPTQLRGRQGASFELLLVRFRRRKSSWAHQLASEGATLGEDTFRVPERSPDQIQGNPSDPLQRIPGRSV